MKRRAFLGVMPVITAGTVAVVKGVSSAQEGLIDEFAIGRENGQILHLDKKGATFQDAKEFYEQKLVDLQDREIELLRRGG